VFFGVVDDEDDADDKDAGDATRGGDDLGDMNRGDALRIGGEGRAVTVETPLKPESTSRLPDLLLGGVGVWVFTAAGAA